MKLNYCFHVGMYLLSTCLLFPCSKNVNGKNAIWWERMQEIPYTMNHPPSLSLRPPVNDGYFMNKMSIFWNEPCQLIGRLFFARKLYIITRSSTFELIILELGDICHEENDH